MNNQLNERFVLASPSESVRSLINALTNGSRSVFGIALIVDEDLTLHGLLNNADILRLLAEGINLDTELREVIARMPITAPVEASTEEIVRSVRAEMISRTGGKKDLTRFVPLVDETGRVCDVVDLFVLLSDSSQRTYDVEIYGLGFVGLTLSVALANRGHRVVGIDLDNSLVASLKQGEPHIVEPRLSDMIQTGINNGLLSFTSQPESKHKKVVIIAVGTPVSADGQADLTSLLDVCRTLGPRIVKGDLIMLRSTVPVGTTNGHVRQILEHASGFTAGKDFNLAFSPERTLEGQAILELTTLPQIVGGFSQACIEKATGFWQTLTDSVIRLESLEAAELVKLINNSFRDLSFAFSNGVALLADHYNIDATRVIAAANEGYPRNPISRPSPGVGGYCLTKDPYLYASVKADASFSNLSRQGRIVNQEAALYPIKVLDRFTKRLNKPFSEIKVLIAGIAFKGWPETNDIRGSVGLETARLLITQGYKVMVSDQVLVPHVLMGLGLPSVSLADGAFDCDAYMILNNHPGNVPEGLLERLQGRPTLLFDGWSLIDRHEVERYTQTVYANMGYMTPVVH